MNNDSCGWKVLSVYNIEIIVKKELDKCKTSLISNKKTILLYITQVYKG